MSHPPPGLGGGAARTGPPPGFGTSNASGMNPANSAGGIGGGTRNNNNAAQISKTQIVLSMSSLTDETFERGAKDIRDLASSSGPEVYHYYLSKLCANASPSIQGLNTHFHQYKEDPAAPPHNTSTPGPAAVAWRLLVSEAARAARDPTLAPQFALVVLSPMNSTSLPVTSLRLFGLPPQFLFFLAAHSLAATSIFPPAHPSYKQLEETLYQSFDATMSALHAPAPGPPFWTYQTSPAHAPFSEDLSMQEARDLLLAIYPRSQASESVNSRPPTPTKTMVSRPSLLPSYHRASIIEGLYRKLQSPAVVFQTLSALSPGGPPGSPDSIPLEDILLEIGELRNDGQAVKTIIQGWWRPWILDSEDLQLRNAEMTRMLHGLAEGASRLRSVSLKSLDTIVEVLAEIPDIAWPDVVKSFDLPGLVQIPMSVPLLIKLILDTSRTTPVLAVAGLLPAKIDSPLWHNTDSLLVVIQGIIDRPPDQFPLFTKANPDPSAFVRVVDRPTEESELPSQAQIEATELQGAGIYNTMGFIVVIVAVFEMGEADESNAGLYDAVQTANQMLNSGFQVAPELVILGLEKLNKPLPGRAHVMREDLWKEYLIGHHEGKSTTLVFHQLWSSNPEGFMERLVEFYLEDPSRIERVVDIGESLSILGMLLESHDTDLMLDVAAVCADRELVDLETWLADGIEIKGDEFLQNIFDFVENKIRAAFVRRDRQFGDEEEEEIPCYHLSPAVYSIFIRVIRNAPDLSPEDVSRFRRMRTDILILHPRLLNLYPGSKEEQGFTETKVTKDQAAQYEDYFKSMYNGNVSVDQQFQDLKRMHESNDPADREFFSGCLHLLFDEFKWFDRYPPKQLAMTSVLFGTLIASRIIKDIPAFVATRYLSDACKTDISKPTYSFGVYAVYALRASLVDFPGLCRSLQDIENLRSTHKDLAEAIDTALKERAELDSQGGVKLAFPALRLPMFVEEGYDEFVEPEPKKKDAIMFIINQIAPSNYEQKSRDLLELFEDQYSRWFAHYFIEVRVSLEQNRHEIYMNIVEILNSPVLEKHILWETYRKTRDLINADTTMSSSSQRASLKTIALWLGRLTLARNKPIRMRELSVKDMLIQGYDNKRLIVAIPFVCNLLASCKESTVFHLPNPWLSAMLGLLVEIYTFPEVRLNLKFEIEVLFTKLEVALNAVEPSTILRNRVPPSQPQGDAPDRLEQEYRKILTEMTHVSARMRTFGSDEAPSEVNEWFIQRTEELLARLPDAMVFTPEFPFFQMNSAKRAVHDATSLAIREMISPVVERSVTIAGISTRDLLAKDFSTEADSAKLRHAAQLMVKNLAGNLAMVTCKDPLRDRMTSSIRTALVAAGFPESGMPDHTISGIVDDNLEAATAVLKSLTVDKASKDIDVNLAAHFASRRDHHDNRANQHFIDSASVAIALPPGSLPNILRMIPGGLLPQQLRVYEDFAEQPIEQPRVYATNGHGGRNRVAEHDRTGYQQELDSHTRRPSPRPRAMSIQEAVHSFQELAVRVDQIIASAPARAVAELPGDHPLRSCIISVIHLINQVAPADQPPAALGIAQKVVQLLYRSDLNLGRETYVTMLQSLCELAAVVDKEVKDWLIHAEDARKLNVPVTITLIQVNMIAIQELDRRMSQMLSRNTLDRAEVEFATELVREISTGESPLSSRNAFVHTLTSMLKLQENGMSDRGIDSLLSSLRRSKVPENPRPAPRHTPVSDNGEPVVIDEKKQAQLKHFFLDWVRTYQTSSDIETAFRPYITYLHNEGILIGEDITTAFYKMAIHVAVDSFGQIGQDDNASIGTDSLAKLMVLIVKNQYNNNRATVPDLARSSYYFRKIITILSYCLIERHLEMGDQFDQRPWTRIFTSLLSELYQLGEQFSPLRRGCLRVLAKVLGTTQPVYAPRFAFGWMSIVSHRSFMPLLLFDDVEGSWSDYHKCLMWLLRFAEPFLKQGEMTHSSRSMYRGICRLFCVLMHDFPEFLDEYYHSFTTAIPPNCVQLRNIALSAFPVRDGPLPDPHRGLDRLLPEMQRYPIVRADYAEALEAGGIKAAIDQHVHTGMPGSDTIVAELRNRIAVKTLSADGPVITWNRTLLHAAVYYLGTSCIARIGEQTGIIEFNPKAAEVTILARLALSLDGEGQYYLLSVVADQLRYPSAHTYFYISFMLYLFVFASRTEQPNSIPDRIGRVLLERIIVQRPHPFGLLVCFVELMEDQQYGFWHQPFAQAPGELHDIFVRVQKNIVRARDDDMDRRAQKQLQAMNEGEEPEYRNSP